MSQEFSPALTATPVRRPRVALLVDGENLSQDRAGQVIMAAKDFGEMIIRRVYGHAPRCPTWLAAPGFHFRQAGTGKNSADLLLTVDAMDIMLCNRADLLVIASSDSDFSHVATFLREAGRRVIGIGLPRAADGFGKHCSEFLPLKETLETTSHTPEAMVSALIREAGPEGLTTFELNVLVQRRFGFAIGITPEQTWKKWLANRPTTFLVTKAAGETRVRCMQKAQV